MPRELLDSALATQAPQPIAALVELPDWTWAHLLGAQKVSAPLIVVLAGIQDPGNLGTILRSAEAFGADGVLCLARHSERLEPEGGARLGGKRLSPAAVARAARQMLLRICAKRACSILDHHRARAAEPADLVDLAEPWRCSLATKATACR